MRNLLSAMRAKLLQLPLTVTLIVAVLLPCVAAMGLIGWYSINLLEQHTRARMQKDIELVARAIRLPLSHALARGYEGTVERALESAFSIERVYGVYVYDDNGNTIYSSGARSASMASDRAVRIANRGQRQGEFGRAGTEEIFSYFVPLVDPGERISGLLQITRRGSDFDLYVSQLRSRSALVVVLSAIILVLIILFGYRWALGRHLAAVEAGLARIRSGQLHHRLERSGPRELQLLVLAINEMLDAIVRSGQALAAQKDREAALNEKLHQAEKLASLGQLAAGVAHELGSPLSTMDGKAQRALRHATLAQPAGADMQNSDSTQAAPAKVIEALHSIRREAARMERIIRQLLDFGRTNTLDLRSVPAQLPLISALSRVDIPSHLTVEQRVEAETRLGFVNVDMVRLEQALTNFLSNAVHAAQTKVVARCSKDSAGIRYCFDDDGEGISKEVRPHLFEPFFTTKPVGQGTGLGLAVAHAAARDHGGFIEVAESDGGGACFCLVLPQEEQQRG